ncbi:ATP5S [Bugula neritina]|uniref:ATP5S n=1 Tax=Bugula neritina TaxID=10212 RepID=A0A7J7K5U2_BUGNE|nr:ATP5S [Bugula neritina]
MNFINAAKSALKTKSLFSYRIYQHAQARKVYWILYAAGNKIDEDRIKQVGADRACAEWLLKCGAQVKFHSSSKFISDYNRLSATLGSNMKLAEVRAEEATIMSIGFPHFDGVKELKKLSFIRCTSFNDSCINQLVQYIGPTITKLEIIGCGSVTDKGVAAIKHFGVKEDWKN